MKRIITCMLAPALIAFAAAGCSKDTAKDAQGKELTLVRPASQTLEQGKTNGILLVISRRGFDSPVKIDFDNLPKGVKVAEDEVIPAGDTTRTFTLVAEDDAALVSKVLVRVEAKAEGLKATETFELTVKAKSS